MLGQRGPALRRITLVRERVASFDAYPFSVPAVRALDVAFSRPVTFLIGENGSGKSTIVEGIASLMRLPLSGGGTADMGLAHGPRQTTPLGDALRPSFTQRPRDAYFFRGQLTSHFAALLDERNDDPYFRATGNPYALYGGVSLRERSHGEGFLGVMQNRIGVGLYLFDEPEVALSPRSQLTLMKLIAARAREGAQFIVATHSPMLMTVPGADILRIEGERIAKVRLEDTEHYQIVRDVLASPASYWKHLDPEGEIG